MNIQRLLSIYSKTNNALLEEIDVSNIPLDIFRRVLKIDKDDLNIYKPYRIDDNGILELKRDIPQLSILNLDDSVEVYLEAFR